jgi:FMN phosphatase YigB (HAD superfamily)
MAEDCIYVDDSGVNVAAARGLGFDAIHFHDGRQVRAEMAARGLVSSVKTVT